MCMYQATQTLRSFSCVLSTGSAYGNHYTTEQVLDALVKQQQKQGNDSFDVDFASRVLKGCGFKYHSISLPLEDVFRRFSRSQYLQHRSTNLVSLAEKAGSEALDRWGGSRSKITHLFWGTMTGAMHSPTIDIELVHRLGLDLNVERTSIEGMGCLTGFRLLNLARQITEADPDARVLIIEADLRSALGNSLPENPTREDIVSVCLFRDAASSAVISCSSKLTAQENPCYEIVTGSSRIIKETSHLVRYFETGDGSICLHLDKKLPEHIGATEPAFVGDLMQKAGRVLQKHGVQYEIPSLQEFDILCHTGGPRVLSEVANSLGISKSSMQSSWDVMTMHGNLSGASNLAVLDHHNEMTKKQMRDTIRWVLCLSMGPGVCLEGLVLRNVKRNLVMYSHLAEKDPRPVVHIVGCGIAGATLAAALNPMQYKVRIFEASPEVREHGYGLAIWPSTMKILCDELGIEDIELRKSSFMTVHSVHHKHRNNYGNQTKASQNKGFMKRSTLLKRILSKVEEHHPGCIFTGHRAIKVKFETNRAWTTFETFNSQCPLVTHSCDLLVGADGVNSIVRRYVSLKLNSIKYGNMAAYRFLIASPSIELLEETQDNWNFSVGKTIHSPMYHVSKNDTSLNVVVLEYNGKPPSHPRSASLEELRDVAQRSNLSFIINLIDSEEISDLMCYSTFHVDCDPWYHQNAVLIGDAAHAYGPLTAKMANLAINDAYLLATLLNNEKNHDISKQEEVLKHWENIQRPKFEVTRIRTLRHLQLYTPVVRNIISHMWKFCPRFILGYFQSIFAYDYDIVTKSRQVSFDADPLFAYTKGCINNNAAYCIAIGCFIIVCIQYVAHFVVDSV